MRSTPKSLHIPVHPQQLNSRYAFCIHGHMHGRGGFDYPRYIDAGVDAWDYRPVSWGEIKGIIVEKF